MMKLSATLHKRIVNFLTSLPNIQDSHSQQAFINRVGLDYSLEAQIQFGGSTGQFVELLVLMLIKYGQLDDGRHALEAVLEAAKDYVGQDRREDCDRLIEAIHAYTIEPDQIPPALEKTEEELRQIQELLTVATKFLQQINAEVTREKGKAILNVHSINGQLQSYTPLSVLVVNGEPTDNNVMELVKHAPKIGEERSNYVGLLLYREPPDTLCRMKITEVRFSENFIVIPLPLASVEKVILDNNACFALLTQYVERYLPGANLFDDRNAISDTFSFFGRLQLIHRVAEELQRNQGLGLFGLRKSGKTSILLQIGILLRKYPVVHIDLQIYGGRKLYGAELFNQIIQQLSQLIKIAQIVEKKFSFSLDELPLFPIDQPAKEVTMEFSHQIIRLTRILQEVGYKLPIICLLDEIERILPSSNDPNEKVEEFNAFFGVLRTLSQHHRNFGILIADVHPDCNRINQWSQIGVPTNPVYSFFKEIFITPFSEEDTITMLQDIGKLMEITFDQKTLSSIHVKSGGQPFIARQLASLLHQEISHEAKHLISWEMSQEYLEDPLLYSGLLIDYFDQNIWADLNKRHFQAEMLILRTLAAHRNGLTRRDLLLQLNSECSKNKIIKALHWLEKVGLIEKKLLNNKECYCMQIPLLTDWLEMEYT